MISKNSPSDFTRAINAVLLELADILSDYHGSFVVSGGLAMHLLFGGDSEEGSAFARITKDVDVVLNLFLLDRDF